MESLKELAVVMLAVCLVTLVIESEGKPVIKKLDEQSMRAIDELAKQMYPVLNPNGYYEIVALNYYQKVSYYMIVLKALKNLDPSSARKVATKLIKRDQAFNDFMDKIRVPCVTFLGQVDPEVDQYPAEYYEETSEGSPEQFSKWHFYKNSCTIIVEDWGRILEGAKEVYVDFFSLKERV